MRKSVLLLGNYPPPYGGVPTHLKYLADYLSTRSWDVHVVSFVGPQAGIEHQSGYPVYRLVQRRRRAQLLRLAWADFRPLLRRPGTLMRSPRRALSLLGTASFVRDLVRRHDIRLISAYHLLGAGTVGAWLSEELGSRLITTVFGEIYSQPGLHRRHLSEVRQIVRQSRRLLSCSHHCAASFRLLGLDPTIETVYYGIDTDRFSPNGRGIALRARLGIMPESPVVLYVARMVREMGLHVLMAAIPQVLREQPDVTFIVVGGRGELTREAETLAASHTGRVFVVADAPFDELPAYYDACDIAVAPSVNARACQGLAIVEAMATGKPVIGARVGGTAEVIAEGETGLLVPPEDAQALAQAIVGLISDKAARDRLGQLGRARALERFDKDQTNRRMETIFEEVLA